MGVVFGEWCVCLPINLIPLGLCSFLFFYIEMLEGSGLLLGSHGYCVPIVTLLSQPDIEERIHSKQPHIDV